MATASRERKSQRIFWTLILALLLGYGAVKYIHIVQAIEVYKGQVLEADISGAAK